MTVTVMQRVCHASLRIIGRAVSEAALGAFCGAAFGEFFGGLWVLEVDERLWMAAATAFWMALCGAVICGVVGVIGALNDEIKAWPTSQFLPEKVNVKTPDGFALDKPVS